MAMVRHNLKWLKTYRNDFFVITALYNHKILFITTQSVVPIADKFISVNRNILDEWIWP